MIVSLGTKPYWVESLNSKFISKAFHVSFTLTWCGNSASMVNRLSYDNKNSDSAVQQLTSDAVIEVDLELAF